MDNFFKQIGSRGEVKRGGAPLSFLLASRWGGNKEGGFPPRFPADKQVGGDDGEMIWASAITEANRSELGALGVKPPSEPKWATGEPERARHANFGELRASQSEPVVRRSSFVVRSSFQNPTKLSSFFFLKETHAFFFLFSIILFFLLYNNNVPRVQRTNSVLVAG